MSDIAAKKSRKKIAEILCKETHFSKNEIESLLEIYSTLTETKISRFKFREILHNAFEMTDDVLMERIFKLFDTKGNNLIEMDEWIKGLSVFLKGTQEEKIKFCFKIYDINNDGFITREEMFHFLQSSFNRLTSEDDQEEGIKDLVDLTIKKMDRDHDGKISYEDFHQAILRDPLLLETFGPCLPDSKSRDAFLSTFAEKFVAQSY